MRRQVFSFITIFFVIAAFFALPVSADVEYETIFEQDFSEEGVTLDSLIQKGAAVSSSMIINEEQSRIQGGQNDWIMYAGDLGTGFKVTGSYQAFYNGVYFEFNTLPSKTDDSVTGYSGGYSLLAMLKDSTASHFLLAKSADNAEQKVDLNSKFNTSIYADFEFLYVNGNIKLTVKAGNDEKSFAYDLSEGGTKNLTYQRGSFVIRSNGSEAMRIKKLKIEKVISPEITIKDKTLSYTSVYDSQDNVNVAFSVNRSAEEIASSKLYIGDKAYDIAYDDQTGLFKSSASLTDTANGYYDMYAVITDTGGGSSRVDFKGIYVAPYSLIYKGAYIGEEELKSLADASGERIKVKLDTDIEDTLIAMMSVIKEGKCEGVTFKTVDTALGEIEFDVPQDTNGVTINVSFFKDISNPYPLGGNIEIK